MINTPARGGSLRGRTRRGALVVALAGMIVAAWREYHPTSRPERSFAPYQATAASRSARAAPTQPQPNGVRATNSFSVNSLVIENIAELLAEARQLGPADRDREDNIRRTLLAYLTDGNAASILAALSPTDRRSEFGTTALGVWASQDPNAAGLWLSMQRNPTPEQIHSVASALADAPGELDAFLSHAPAITWRDQLLEAAIARVTKSDPGRAADLARGIGDDAARTRTLLELADEWARRDPAATAQWIASQRDGDLRDSLVSAAAAAQASSDPMAAIDWVLTVNGTDRTIARGVSAALAIWSTYSPIQARAFSNAVRPILSP